MHESDASADFNLVLLSSAGATCKCTYWRQCVQDSKNVGIILLLLKKMLF